MTKIDAFIPAATGRESEHYDELLDLAGVENKALIEFQNKPMLEYVVDALDQAKNIRSITIVGQTETSFPVECSKPVNYIEGGETTFETTIKAVEYLVEKENPPKYALSLASDLPLITAEMVDRSIDAIDFSKNYEFYWNLVLKEDVEKYYPEATKVAFNLREAKFHFGDIQIFRPSSVETRKDTLKMIMGNRKSVIRIARMMSIWNVIKYIFGFLSIKDIKTRFKNQFDLDAAMLLTEFPEACVDLDYAKDMENFKRWMGEERRNFGKEEKAIVLENREQVLSYLEEREKSKSR